MTVSNDGKPTYWDQYDIGEDSVEDLREILDHLRYQSQISDSPEIYIDIGRVTRQLEILNEQSA